MTVNRRSQLIRPGADFVDILEAAYAPEEDDETWLRRVVEATERVLQNVNGIGIVVIEHDETGANARATMGFAPGIATVPEVFDALFARIGPNGVREFFYPGPLVSTHSELGRLRRSGMLTDIRASSYREGEKDALGILAHPEPGVASVLFCRLPELHATSQHERRVLSRLALHLESALRLRLQPEAVVAVLAPDGKLLHREEDAPSTEALAFGAKVIERTRLRSKRTLPDAIAVWHALVGGRVSLVERESHGQRHYLVLENAPASREQRLLSRNEASVVGLAARGLTGKLIAYALGLSPAAVSAHLTSAAMKFGLPTRLALVRLASQFTFDKELVATTRLTAAEREVLELIRVGLSNRAIAERRDRSERTVANQVAALLEKTGSSSRRALVTSR